MDHWSVLTGSLWKYLQRPLGPTLLSLFRFCSMSSRDDSDYRHGSLERARRTTFTLEILTLTVVTWTDFVEPVPILLDELITST